MSAHAGDCSQIRPSSWVTLGSTPPMSALSRQGKGVSAGVDRRFPGLRMRSGVCLPTCHGNKLPESETRVGGCLLTKQVSYGFRWQLLPLYDTTTGKAYMIPSDREVNWKRDTDLR